MSSTPSSSLAQTRTPLTLSMSMPPLRDGSQIPVLGLGVYKLHDAAPVVEAVDTVGYRLIDTAKMYENEHLIGQALKQMKTPREQVYITTKLHSAALGGGDKTRKAIEDSLAQLGVDYIDLLLVHTPEGGEAFRLASWATMAEFVPHKLLNSEQGRAVPPVLNQVEAHPLNAARELRAYCKERGIAVEAYCPLARGRDLENPVLMQVAQEVGRPVSQVMLRWLVQHGVIPLPKSSNPARQAENAASLEFGLSQDQMDRIDKLDRGLEGKVAGSATLLLEP